MTPLQVCVQSQQHKIPTSRSCPNWVFYQLLLCDEDNDDEEEDEDEGPDFV